MGFIIYNGRSSEDFHVLVQHPPVYEFPARDYTLTHVPGRNGDIITDNEGWKNVKRTYDVAIDARQYGYTTTMGEFVSWLSSGKGYSRLEDSYEPDYYRLATFYDAGSISNILRQAGIVDLQFDCKPQRYLKIGETPVAFSTNGKITNLTAFNANPTIVVHGSGRGVIYIGPEHIITINTITDGMVIDGMIQDVYKGTTNLNNSVSFTKFPVLGTGETNITFSGGITSIEIIPNWWTL